MHQGQTNLLYAVFDRSSEQELVYVSNSFYESSEYLTTLILNSLKYARSMGLHTTDPDFSNFKIDVLEFGFKTRKIDTLTLNDFGFVSENQRLVDHNGSVIRDLREIKQICNGNEKKQKAVNKNCSNLNRKKFLSMQQKIEQTNPNADKSCAEEYNPTIKNPITSGFEFLKNMKEKEMHNKKQNNFDIQNSKDTSYIPDILEQQKKEKIKKRNARRNNSRQKEEENSYESESEKRFIPSSESTSISSYDTSDNSESDQDLEDFENDTISSVVLNSEIEKQIDDPEQLLEMVDELKKAKNESKDYLKDLKKKLKKETLNLAEYNFQVNCEKQDLDRYKDKQQSEKNVFESERRFTYPKIKKHIDSGKSSREYIPDMFVSKYPIFEFMDENNLLYKENAFEVFKSLYDELNKEEKETDDSEKFIPHNINYLTEKERQKFLQKHKKSAKKIKPLDDILKNLDDIENTLDLDSKSAHEGNVESKLKETNSQKNKDSNKSGNKENEGNDEEEDEVEEDEVEEDEVEEDEVEEDEVEEDEGEDFEDYEDFDAEREKEREEDEDFDAEREEKREEYFDEEKKVALKTKINSEDFVENRSRKKELEDKLKSELGNDV